MRRLGCLLGASIIVAAGCGTSGVRTLAPLKPCKVPIAGVPRIGSGFAFGSGLAAELPDGSLVVGTSRSRGSRLRIVLRRVGQNCRAVSSFGQNGTATIAINAVNAARFGVVDSILPTSDGHLLLAGSDGRHELVGRLLPNGRLDRSFGHDGWTRVVPHEKPLYRNPPPVPTATSIALGPSGSIFLGGDNGQAHCCVQDFVTELSSDGTAVRGFGHGGSVILRRFRGSFSADVFVDGNGGLYALGQLIFGGCGGPVMARIRPDGSLDSGFDSAVARSIRDVETRRQLLFTPALVVGQPPGGFVLVGGLSRQCGPVAHPHFGGVAVGVLGSGRIDRSYGRGGEAHFAAPNAYAFDTSAVRLPSGGVLAVAPTYADSGYFRTLKVQALSGSGSLERGRSINVEKLPRTYNVSFSLVPATDRGAWIVLGFPKEIDLIPVVVGS